MSPVSRRTLLKGAGITAFGAASIGVLPLFGTPDATQDPLKCRAKDLSNIDRSLYVSNWPAYIDEADPDDPSPTTLDLFEKETGISVTYTQDVNDNAEFFAKVRNQLGSCQSIKRDLIVLTDWMAARMIGLGWIQPLDHSRMPNFDANLIDSLRNRQWDPDRTYSAPWQAGFTAIAYNASKVKEVKSFEELLTRPDLKGRVTLLSEMRDTMGFMLRVVGADPSKFNDTEWENAIERLRKAVSSGQVRAFSGNDYMLDLSVGNIVACEAWAGDVIQAQFDNPDIKFVVPEEGLSLWADNMMVPNLAQHQENAEKWIDFYYQPKIAAMLAAWNNYICPVKGGQEAMEEIEPEFVDNQLIFPSDETMAKAFDFMPLNDVQTRKYEREWSNVIGG